MSAPYPIVDRLLELTRAAIQLQQVGLHGDALEILEKILSLDPAYATAYVVRGLSLQAIQNPEDAEAAFRQALKLERGNELAIKSLGLLLVNNKKYEDGIGYLSRYYKKHPDDTITLNALVSAYTILHRMDEVKTIFEHSWQTTRDVDLGIQFTRFLLGQGDNESALKVITDVVEKSTTPRTLSEQSLVLVVLKKYELAIEKLDQALDLDPNFDRALRGLSFCYTKLGRFEEAIDAADRALEINDRHYRNLQARGDALLALGKFDEALITAQKAIELIDLKTDPEAEPVLAALYQQRFNAYLGLNKTEDALKEMEHARGILPHEIRFFVYPAQLDLGLGNARAAQKLLDQTESAGLLDVFPGGLRMKILLEAGQYPKVWEWLDPQMNNELIQVLMGLAYQYYVEHDDDISRNIFEHLLERVPGNSAIATPLAFILTGYGEYEKAESLLNMVLEKGNVDNEPLVRCNLGYIYLATGSLDRAKACFGAVLEQAADDDEAIARIGFWQNQTSELCCTPYPVQTLPLKLVANANLVAIHLQENNLNEAENISDRIIEQYPDLSLSYQLVGNIYFVKNNFHLAHENWEKALALSADDVEKEMIKDWLNRLIHNSNQAAS
ncbi:MAG: tetratricopeptide repeat protein [Chloroflexi bacterium]|nr:tetratricopeptide repeat protein [Chloroflexota bacterium]